MSNQSTSDKKDKTGGDVTKAEVVATPEGDKTVVDLWNSHGSTEALS